MCCAVSESVAPVHRFILLTDIVQSSRLTEQYPQKYLAALAQHDRLIEQAVDRNSGQIYKHTGDGYYALFETAGACLNAGLELGAELEQLEPLAENEPLAVRLVLHGGDLQPSGRDYFGPALNRASRICQVCNPGQVLLSAAVAVSVGGASGQLHGTLSAGPAARTTGYQLRDLGLHYLRDLAEPEHLYQLDSETFARREFPPLSTLNNRPNNLVMQPNAFIGRERELAELAALLTNDTRLLSIVAPGGYGKTRLAAQLCANLLHRFERGVFMAYLAPIRDSSLVTTAIAGALNFQFSGSREPQEQLYDYLREKELLLCLDNFEHVLDCAPLVSELLAAAPQLKVVITSREPLRLDAERICRLEPLAVGTQSAADGAAPAEAELLFADRAALVSSDFALSAQNTELVRQICAKLSGIPLAIELAAAWMDTFTLAELRAELAQQLELEARTSDKPARHRSLKASLDWSWNLLGGEQQIMLMRLSTFRGGFSGQAAAAMVGLEGLALRTALGRLADKSWLYARQVDGQSRFYLRDMLARDYVFEKLRDSELYEPVILAHTRYYSALMQREGPRFKGDGTPTGQVESLRTVQLELDNVDQAFDILQSHLQGDSSTEGKSAELPAAGNDAAELLLPIARWLTTYLDMISAYRAMLTRYEALLAACGAAEGFAQLRLRAMLACGQAQARLGSFDTARAILADVRTRAAEIEDSDLGSSALVMLGNLALHQGNYEAARELYGQALTIRRQRGDRLGISYTLNNLGLVEYMQGNYRAAGELYAESLAFKREICDRFGIGPSLGNLGMVELRQGNYSAARAFYEESLIIRQESGDRRGIATAHVNLGMVEFHQGNFNKARLLFEESLAINREIGERSGIAYSLINLGSTEFMQGNSDRARQLLADSLAIRREIGHRRGTADSLISLGIVEEYQGNSTAARELFVEALELRREIGDRSGLCEAVAAAGGLLARTGVLPSAALCHYGALHHSVQLNLKCAPMERSLLEQGIAIVEHPETGLPPAKREQLKAQAETMSLDELTEFAREELVRYARE